MWKENNLNSNNKDKESLIESENSYQLKIDDITVNIEYTKNNKYFNQCILNILKLKNKFTNKS